MIKISQFVISLFIAFSASARVDDSSMIRKIADEVLINAMDNDNLRLLCKKIGPRLKAVGIPPKRTIRAIMFMNGENGGRVAQK